MDSKKIKTGAWCLYYGLFLLVNFNTSIAYEYSSIEEQFVGLLLSTALMSLINFAVYLIAFKLTGALFRERFIFRSEMKEHHWLIRLILGLIVFGLCSTSFFSGIISPLIPLVIEKYHDWLHEFVNNITHSITSSF